MGIMLEIFWNLDLTIYKFINQTLSFNWLDQITPILTNLDNFLFLKIAAPLIVFFFFYKKYKRTGITYFLFLVLSLSTSDFVGGKVKKIFLRPRPFQIAETETILKAQAKENRSFYSNHASNNFTAATFLTAFFPAGQVYFYSVATLIALTRPHVGVHYPSDILAGALMGLLWGFIFSRMAKLLTAKIMAKKNENPT
jgi:undecaprenyl-diphosphatase